MQAEKIIRFPLKESEDQNKRRELQKKALSLLCDGRTSAKTIETIIEVLRRGVETEEDTG